MSIQEFPATHTGIFYNPPQRRITLQWQKGGKRPSKKDMRAVDEMFADQERDKMDGVQRLLVSADDWVHHVMFEELLKADPSGQYIFVEGACQIPPRPDGDLVYRGVWKFLPGSSENPMIGRVECVSALPTQYKMADANSVRRITVEQRDLIAALIQALPAGKKEGQIVMQQLGTALLAMYRLGWLTCQIMVRDREPDAKRGKKVLDSAREAHEQTHGTAKQKQERWALYQKEVDRLRHKHPDWSKTSIHHRAASLFGVTPKTIRRHTKILF